MMYAFVNPYAAVPPTSVHSRRYNMLGVSEGVAQAWFTQLVGVVKFCSSRGVAHRDLKLKNVWVDVNGHVIVTDFELGCMLPDGVADKVNCDIIGTLMYIPPEVVKEKVCYERNGKSDLWAVGVICWKFLCPSNPWNVDFGRVREREVVKVRNEAPRTSPYILAHAHLHCKTALLKLRRSNNLFYRPPGSNTALPLVRAAFPLCSRMSVWTLLLTCLTCRSGDDGLH